VLLADATSQSEQVRGQGDAERNRIYAEAYGQDPGFFGFYRSMQAYERSMQHGDTHLVLRPDSDFFRYFGDPSGKSLPQGGNTAAPAPGTAAAPNPPSASSATK
jgi:membrane protease subunit HflC